MIFLTREEVLRIHGTLLSLYGGGAGIRDEGTLLSALAQPEASFDGVYLHGDVYDMAAAYAFHVGQGQAFVDGNKRTALACMLVFLELNGSALRADPEELYAAMMAVAERRLSKVGLAAWLRER